MATNPSLIGRLVAGRYRLQQRRGSGAFGMVLDAIDEQTQGLVAVKILLPQFASDVATEARFRLEAQLAASLAHPNLDATYDWGVEWIEDVRVPFLVLEHLGGGSLRDMIDRGRLLSPSQALALGLEVCRGLDYLHRHGVIHRDIRPANLAFGEDRGLRILDVGVSRYFAETTWEDPSAAGIDAARYASPEQARGASTADGTLTAATDIYSLCLVLIESVTGQVPFASDSTVATLNARLDKLMPVSADFGPLASVLSRAGNADPAERYTAAELGRALVQAAEKLPRPAPLMLVGTVSIDNSAGIRRPADPTGPLHRPEEPVAERARRDPSTLDPALLDPALLDPALLDPVLLDPAPLDPAPLGPAVFMVAPADADSASRNNATVDAGAPAPLSSVPLSSVPLGGAATLPVGPGLPPLPGVASHPVVTPLPPPPPSPAGAFGPAGDSAGGDHGVGDPAPIIDFDIEDDFPGPKKSRRGLWIGAALVVVAAVVVGFLVVRNANKVTSRPVPELAGMTEAVARNQIAENGWTIVVTKERNDGQPADNVIRTDPAAGVSLKSGDTITLVVSDGPTLAVLLDVTGQTVEAATALLAASKLDLTVAQEVYDEQVPTGTIMSWSVPAQPGLTAGAQVMQRTVVSVVVSKGPEPRQVPSLFGMDEATATAALANLGLGIVRAPDIFSNKYPVGQVADQSLPAGTAIQRGESVTIAISKGVDLVSMPPLAGLTYPQIEAALTAAGLQVGAITGDKVNGTIISATFNGVVIQPGQQFPRGTAIDLQFT